jgi:hypothetical protein
MIVPVLQRKKKPVRALGRLFIFRRERLLPGFCNGLPQQTAQ